MARPAGHTPTALRANATRRALARAAALVVLCAPLFLYRLGAPALTDPDEGRNAEVAREMLATGDWITPHLNEARYLDKPPAFFWAVAASMRLFGVGELGARIPSALCALLGVLLTWRFARRHLGPPAAWLSAIILALSPLYLVFGRMVIFDMMLTLCMTASVMAAFEAMEGDGRPAARIAPAVFFAAAGIGTITKGPVGLAVPLLVAAAWAIARGRPAALGRLRFASGILIYAGVVLPWLLLISAWNPGYLRYALLGESLERLASNRFETARPVYFYLKILIPGLFPWILYVAAASVRRAAAAGRALERLRRRTPEQVGGRERVERFAAIWAGAVFIFFSLVSSKRPAYILPLAVPIALLAGSLWARREEEAHEGEAHEGAAHEREARRDLAAGSSVVALACLLLAAAIVLAGPGGLGRTIGGGLYESLMGRERLFMLTAAGLVATALLILMTRRSRRPAAAFFSAVLSIAVMVPMARAAIGSFEEVRSSRGVGRFLARRIRPGDSVICFEEYHPGLNFYLRRPVDLVSGPGRTFTSNYIKMHIDEFRGDPSFHGISPETLREKILADGSRAFVLAPRRSYDDLRAAAGVPLRAIYEDRVGSVFVRAGAGP